MEQVAAIGSEIRELKTSKAAKDVVMAKVAELKVAKEAYEVETGQPFPEPNKQGSSKDKKKSKQEKEGRRWS